MACVSSILTVHRMLNPHGVRLMNRSAIAIFLMVATSLAATGWLADRDQTRGAIDACYQQLTTIAQLKAAQTEEWRTERLNGASVLAAWPQFAPAVERWQRDATNLELKVLVRAYLDIIHTRLSYADAMLATSDGMVLLSADGTHSTLSPESTALAAESAASRLPRLGSAYRCSICNSTHIDVVTPVESSTGQVLAILILRSDPDASLYPFTQGWPTPSRTAEALIVRNDHGRALFLSRPRHGLTETPVVRPPADRSGAVSAWAAGGGMGRFEGIDYRGVRVLADVRPVLGSPWVVVAKEDADEALAGARAWSRTIAGFVLGGILLSGTVLTLVARQRQRDLFDTLYEAADREKALLEVSAARDQYLSSILDRVPTEIYVFDVETLRLAYANAAALQHLDYTLDGARALTIPDVCPDFTDETVAARFAGVRAGDRASDEFEMRHRTRRGEFYPVLVRIHASSGAAGRQFVVAAVDITERRRLVAQLEQAHRIEAIGRLAGGVAHDFNNLLTVINGNAELALSLPGSSDQLRESLAEIDAAGRRAADLTHQLLAFSRKQMLLARVVDLNDVVSDVERLLRRLIGENVRVMVSLAPSLCTVRADPGQIQQVLMNLAVNSRDAMPAGGTLTIATVKTTVSDESAAAARGVPVGTYAALWVTDTGSGMTEETRSRIFEPFFTTKELGKGTGLGLSTVYGIVRQSGGYINVTSQPGDGTAFEILLPAADSGTEASEPAAEDVGSGGRESVLLVEDEPSVGQLAVRMLERAGYRVSSARNGVEALDVFDHMDTPPDLVITDVIMPGMGGCELADRLMVRRPEQRVLFMSGYTDDAQAVASRGPETVFLQKPFTASQLTRQVRLALGR